MTTPESFPNTPPHDCARYLCDTSQGALLDMPGLYAKYGPHTIGIGAPEKDRGPITLSDWAFGVLWQACKDADVPFGQALDAITER